MVIKKSQMDVMASIVISKCIRELLAELTGTRFSNGHCGNEIYDESLLQQIFELAQASYIRSLEGCRQFAKIVIQRRIKLPLIPSLKKELARNGISEDEKLEHFNIAAMTEGYKLVEIPNPINKPIRYGGR